MSNPASNPVVQNNATNNAKYVSIIPENGTEFNEGQKITFNLDPSLGWIKGRDSYLVFDIENTGATIYKWSLRQGGISNIIKQVNIYSQQNGMLLESLDNYNQWNMTELQYRYDDHTNLSNVEGCAKFLCSKKALDNQETDGGVMFHNFDNTSNTVEAHRMTNQNNQAQPQVAPIRLCCPLRCGIFRHWDDETLVPILQMGGLRIELVLAPAVEVYDMPFVADANNKVLGHMIANTFTNVSMVVDDVADNATEITLANPMPIANSTLLVGNRVRFTWTNGGNQQLDTSITAIALDTGKTKLTVADAITPAINNADGQIQILPTEINASNIKYTIRNAEFRLLQEMPPDNKLKNIDYVFTSYDVFRDTIPSSQTSFNQDITSVASKAVSLFTMYEQTRYDDISNFPNGHYYQGLTPSDTGFNFNSVVYFINNKLYPLRPYNPQTNGDRIINQNELVKAFGTLFPVKRLGSSFGSDGGEYTNRYLHGRELARGNSVFNLQNAEPQIRLGFSAPRGQDKYGNNMGNVRMTTYVFSKKILHIDGETGLSIEH